MIDHSSDAAGRRSVRPAQERTVAFDALYLRGARRALLVVLAAYLLVALLYVAATPPWQAPDEPAHYNYIAHIVATGRLPVLHPGDYNQTLLETLLQTHFAPKLPTGGLRYEAYQPPLYYLLATPVFLLTEGSLTMLRLLNVFLGGLNILLLFLCLETVFPGKPLITVGATAFVALLPMHVAVTAAVNNDGLADLLISAAMLVLLRWMRGRFYAEIAPNSRRGTEQLLIVGFLLGLGLVTKIYAYLVTPLVLAAVFLVVWLRPRVGRPLRPVQPRGLGRAVGQSLLVAGPALLLGLPLWLRNIALYGRWDFLGLQQHDRVVAGQPRTVDWIAQVGWSDYIERAFGFTFQSFWGVFGWMGVFMDERVYTALLLLTGALFLGMLWAVVRMISGPPDADMDLFQLVVLGLFGVMLLAVTAGYVVYNVKFVQHQGRYFFWGLLPISTIVALGWRELMHPLQGLITAVLAVVLAVSMALSGLLSSGVDKWTILIIGLFALLLLLQPLLLGPTHAVTLAHAPAGVRLLASRAVVIRASSGLRTVAWAMPYLLLFLLNLANALLLIPQQLGG